MPLLCCNKLQKANLLPVSVLNLSPRKPEVLSAANLKKLKVRQQCEQRKLSATVSTKPCLKPNTSHTAF
ncbi:hypothetical protein CANCADRAFT_96408 [Tortispora caseinolytica NRRL Y-17796]|uniref:Uncharacterized protein n=1 Tax=Tortispora caseinolytica NRRL Y-17796 TaxID=767744 RepID=A0A1E4TMK4_9ASCO|nr:hypothetical protein CANCADRAFT_96408 [Tortispora caseinolytica NRRL Y-17796]